MEIILECNIMDKIINVHNFFFYQGCIEFKVKKFLKTYKYIYFLKTY